MPEAKKILLVEDEALMALVRIYGKNTLSGRQGAKKRPHSYGETPYLIKSLRPIFTARSS